MADAELTTALKDARGGREGLSGPVRGSEGVNAPAAASRATEQD